MRDIDAKAIVDSFAEELTLTPEENLAIRLVGKHETGYGDGWKNEGKGSNNWGANTAPRGGPDTFKHGDSRYDPQTGKVISYETHFPKYATPRDGAIGLAKVLLCNDSDPKKGRRDNVALALENGSIVELATAMRLNRYYLGVKPFAEAVAAYAGALERAYRDIQQDTGERTFDAPKAEGSPEQQGSGQGPQSSLSAPQYLQRLSRSLPVLQQGNRGDLVGILQFELGVSPDEIFGPKTERALLEFQELWGIETDVSSDGKPLRAGVVGVKTWAKLFEVETPREENAQA